MGFEPCVKYHLVGGKTVWNKCQSINISISDANEDMFPGLIFGR